MKLKKIAAMLVFVMVFSACGSAFAEYRTGSAVGDGAAYGAAGAVVGGGVAVAAAWWTTGTLAVLCPPVGIAAIVGAACLGWYGLTEDDKTIAKDAGAVVSTASTIATVGADKLAETALKVAHKILR